MRRTKNLVISADGRDKGKTFLLTEMPATQAEKWAAKAFLALARGGIDIPQGVSDMGLAGLAAIGIKALAGVRFDDAEPLMDEMFASCVAIIPDPSRPAVKRGHDGIGPMTEDDIEEVRTRMMIRKELFELHLGFSLPASPSISAPAGSPTDDATPNT